jgi:hypothetical protein
LTLAVVAHKSIDAKKKALTTTFYPPVTDIEENPNLHLGGASFILLGLNAAPLSVDDWLSVRLFLPSPFILLGSRVARCKREYYNILKAMKMGALSCNEIKRTEKMIHLATLLFCRNPPRRRRSVQWSQSEGDKMPHLPLSTMGPFKKSTRKFVREFQLFWFAPSFPSFTAPDSIISRANKAPHTGWAV